jgi:ribonuclease P protein component
MNRAIRLRRHADYQRMYAAGRKHFSKQMSYFYAARVPQEGTRFAVPPGPRVGLTVGRVMGNAVTRNRIKRRLRSAIKLHIALLGDLDVDVALHPKRGADTVAWELLERDVVAVFRAIAKVATPSPAPRETA